MIAIAGEGDTSDISDLTVAKLRGGPFDSSTRLHAVPYELGYWSIFERRMKLRMRFPIRATGWHRGQSLEINSDAETLSLLGEKGEPLATISWGTLIHYLWTSLKETTTPTMRNYPRVHLAVKVNYQTTENRQFETLTGNIGGGGVFIEHSAPLQVGTHLAISLFLPDDPAEPVQADGQVAWVRPERIHHGVEAGMGIRFTDISDTGRNRLVRMVTSLEQARHGT